MRKILILLIMIPIPLAAAFYSNSIMQNLSYKENLDGVGYEGETYGNRTVLYLDGEVVAIRTEESNGYSLSEKGRSERVFLDSNGRRTRKVVSEGGVKEITVYEYDGDNLKSKTVSDESGIVKRIEYVDSASGLLTATLGSENTINGTSFFVYESDGKAVRVDFHGDGEAPAENGTITLNDDGSWTLTADDGVNRFYTPDGLIRKIDDGGRVEEFEYEDGIMVSRRLTDGESSVLEEYGTDGNLLRRIEYEDRIPTLVLEILPDGNIETRYSSGVPVFRVLYDLDGRKIRSVENL